MDWRSYAFERISTSTSVLEHVPEEYVFGAGSLKGSVSKSPFIVILFDPETPGPFPGAINSGFVVAVHDEPGDYLRIGTLLRAVRGALVGQVRRPGAVACQWLGDSQDLSDESLGTIYRTATFSAAGLEGTLP